MRPAEFVVDVRFGREQVLAFAEVRGVVHRMCKVGYRVLRSTFAQSRATEQQVGADVLTCDKPFAAFPRMETARL